MPPAARRLCTAATPGCPRGADGSEPWRTHAPDLIDGSTRARARRVVHRIVPVEHTSLLEPEELRRQVPHLAAAFKASPLAAKFAAMHAEGRKIPFAGAPRTCSLIHVPA